MNMFLILKILQSKEINKNSYNLFYFFFNKFFKSNKSITGIGIKVEKKTR